MNKVYDSVNDVGKRYERPYLAVQSFSVICTDVISASANPTETGTEWDNGWNTAGF